MRIHKLGSSRDTIINSSELGMVSPELDSTKCIPRQS